MFPKLYKLEDLTEPQSVINVPKPRKPTDRPDDRSKRKKGGKSEGAMPKMSRGALKNKDEAQYQIDSQTMQDFHLTGNIRYVGNVEIENLIADTRVRQGLTATKDSITNP